MLTYLYANNYKSFVNFRVDFDKINLLIGANGSGKSNVFELIARIRDVIRGDNKTLNDGFNNATLTRWLKSNVQTFELGLSNGDDSFVYRLEIEHDKNIQANRIVGEKVTCEGKILFQMTDGRAVMFDDALNPRDLLADPSMSGVSFVPQDGKHFLLTEFRKLIGKIILCTPDPKLMQDAIQNDVYIPNIGFDNIASSYAGLLQLEPDIYVELSGAIKAVNPAFVKIRQSVEPYAKYLVFDYMYNDVLCSFRLSELSDGEKMLFALYMLIIGYVKRGMTVLLDEPDNYISLREIQPWCRYLENEISEDGQCLMISHHSEVIDYMAEADGIWLSRLRSGETKISETPKIVDNTDLLTYSQLISRGLLDETE